MERRMNNKMPAYVHKPFTEKRVTLMLLSDVSSCPIALYGVMESEDPILKTASVAPNHKGSPDCVREDMFEIGFSFVVWLWSSTSGRLPETNRCMTHAFICQQLRVSTHAFANWGWRPVDDGLLADGGCAWKKEPTTIKLVPTRMKGFLRPHLVTHASLAKLTAVLRRVLMASAPPVSMARTPKSMPSTSVYSTGYEKKVSIVIFCPS